jgi:hypothetical protein
MKISWWQGGLGGVLNTVLRSLGVCICLVVACACQGQSDRGMQGWDFPFSAKQNSNPSSPPDMLWIEFALHCDKYTRSCERLLDGWWGIGEKSSSCSPSAKKELSESSILQCVESSNLGGQFLRTAQLASLVGRCSASHIGINQLGLLGIYLNVESAIGGDLAIVSRNRIGLESIGRGCLWIPKLRTFQNGIHALKGDPQLFFDQVGIVPYRGARLSSNHGKAFLKMVFELGSIHACSGITAQEAATANDDLGFGFLSSTLIVGRWFGDEIVNHGQTIRRHYDPIGRKECKDDCAAGVNLGPICVENKTAKERTPPPIFIEDYH